MIKFFRHIRKSLLEENKMGKYFKYAIGEIILVVIGILIALQINNWNENRKEIKNEIKLVKQLLNDAKSDSVFYNSRSQLFAGQINSFQSLIELCNKNTKVLDIVFFTNESIPFTQAADQSVIINNSFDYNKISNEAIKKNLRDYLLSYSYTNKAINIHSNEISKEFSNLIKTYNLDFKVDDTIMPIKNFLEICDDTKIFGKLKLCIGLSKNAKEQTERLLKDNAKLIKACKNYLND